MAPVDSRGKHSRNLIIAVPTLNRVPEFARLLNSVIRNHGAASGMYEQAVKSGRKVQHERTLKRALLPHTAALLAPVNNMESTDTQHSGSPHSTLKNIKEVENEAAEFQDPPKATEPSPITWDGPDDPENPLNWSRRYRWGVTLLAGLTTM